MSEIRKFAIYLALRKCGSQPGSRHRSSSLSIFPPLPLTYPVLARSDYLFLLTFPPASPQSNIAKYLPNYLADTRLPLLRCISVRRSRGIVARQDAIPPKPILPATIETNTLPVDGMSASLVDLNAPLPLIC